MPEGIQLFTGNSNKNLAQEIALLKANFVDRTKLSERFAGLAEEFGGQS